MRIEVLPNDNPKEREDKHGRVRVSNRRTWLLVVDEHHVHGEYHTKREAMAAAERTRNAVAAGAWFSGAFPSTKGGDPT